MGIPSYFSEIVKKYNTIVHKKVNSVDELYFDANSLIYKSYYEVEHLLLKSNSTTSQIHSYEIEKKIIQKTIQNIESILQKISPKHKVYIAFDGVVPLAKMKQQRERRFKSFFIEELNHSKHIDQSNKNTSVVWDKTNITPGTRFMDTLCETIQHYINETNFNMSDTVNIYLSDVYEYGEGEHKLFKTIENTEYTNTTTICVYGLDADLIVLGLFHLKQNIHLYLFREFEQYMYNFLESNSKTFTESDYIFLYLNNFEHHLFQELVTTLKQPRGHQTSNTLHKERIADYICMTFLCGNDFLPHIPCINLRHNGMNTLLETYKVYLKQKNEPLVKYTYSSVFKKEIYSIQWNNLKIYLELLANNEQDMLIHEIEILNRVNKTRRDTCGHTYRNTSMKTDETHMDISKQPICSELRNIENYINPKLKNWESRYYESLFSIYKSTHTNSIQELCIHYCSGLEWNLNYYMNNSRIDYIQDYNNVWMYKHTYAPLISSLVHHIPSFNETLVSREILDIHPKTQLFFVISYSSIRLLDPIIQNLYIRFFNLKQKENKSIQYSDFQYSFCKYLWEGHLQLDYEINSINDLKQINSIILKNE